MNFVKSHDLSKRNVKLILKILSDLEPLRGPSKKKTLYSTRSCLNWAFLSCVGEFKTLVSLAPKKSNLHTNLLNKLLLFSPVSKVTLYRYL
jgi:hypothetical protein